jgi:DNA-binding NarL/FixJ family response regulator/DNA modification methylase
MKTITLDCGTVFQLPYADIFPPMSEAEFALMKADIGATGSFTYAVVYTTREDGTIAIIDGQHRLRACRELGMVWAEVRKDEILGLSPEQERQRAINLNLLRRHMDKEARQRLVADLAGKGLSNTAIAKSLGISDFTVRQDKNRSGPISIGAERSRITGEDGKSHPSSKPDEAELSERRERVKAKKAEGKSVRAIAKEENISTGTVAADLKAEVAAPVPEESIDEICDRHIERASRLVIDDDEEEACDRCGDTCCGCYTEEAAAMEGKAVCQECNLPEAEPGSDLCEDCSAVPEESPEEPPGMFADIEPPDRPMPPELAQIHEGLKAEPAAKPHPFHDLDLSKSGWKESNEDLITDTLWNLGARWKGPGRDGSYHGNFIPQIVDQQLRRYTKEGAIVLDMFLGGATTMVECLRLGRHIIGVELQSEMVDKAWALLDQLENPANVQIHVIEGDSSAANTPREIQKCLFSHGAGRNLEGVDHVFLHPPYFDIIKFTNGQNLSDLSSAENLEEFLHSFYSVARNAYQSLRPGQFATLVIGDIPDKSETIELSALCARKMQACGFRLVAKNIKDIQGNEKAKGKNANLWRWRALRYGFQIFKHEYVYTFRRPA